MIIEEEKWLTVLWLLVSVDKVVQGYGIQNCNTSIEN